VLTEKPATVSLMRIFRVLERTGRRLDNSYLLMAWADLNDLVLSFRVSDSKARCMVPDPLDHRIIAFFDAQALLSLRRGISPSLCTARSSRRTARTRRG
jgi:hypothetical protein